MAVWSLKRGPAKEQKWTRVKGKVAAFLQDSKSRPPQELFSIDKQSAGPSIPA